MLQIKDIRVHYGKVEAVKGVSLDVDDGDVVALLGANGAGKTTILRTISGLKRPTSGEIWFEGQRLDKMRTPDIVKMGIGHVPEARRVFPDMSVEDNLKMGAYIRNDRDGIREDLEELYGHFPILQQRKRQKAGSLSGGEQQMLAMARALMCKPKIVLMDEPSVGLSPVMEDEISKLITNINQRGIAVLIVEQNAAMALRLANRGYVIETGRIVLCDDCNALMNDDRVKKAYLGG